MNFIADSIGKGYKEWKFGDEEGVVKGDNIFISSPTGRGKTSFIIREFLPYLAEQGKSLLYLVNRTILIIL